MATLTDPTLSIRNENATTVRITVRYRLVPSDRERLAGSVFTENISLIGDDSGTTNDIVISTFNPDDFAVDSSTPFVNRERVISVLKSALNEDPGFRANGSEWADEVFARINVTYGGNPPIPEEPPPPSSTSVEKGAWK